MVVLVWKHQYELKDIYEYGGSNRHILVLNTRYTHTLRKI